MIGVPSADATFGSDDKRPRQRAAAGGSSSDLTARNWFWHGSNPSIAALAIDLVERQVTVIVANSPSIAPAKAATKTIPITFLSGDDPVRLGFVSSLSKPGGNATGVTIFSGELAAKRLELLRELIPQAKIVALLINTRWPATERFQADVEAAAREIALSIQVPRANNESEIDDAFNSLRADALLVGPGPFMTAGETSS